MSRLPALLMRVLVLLTLAAGSAAAQPAGPTPNPPGTGAFSVQMFAGGTKYTYLSLNLPTTYTSGAPIPNGTTVQIKIYRWDWTAKTWGPVQLDAGSGEGPWGSGGRGQAGVNTSVSFVAITPVDCVEPRVVVLGATALVNGVESAMVTNDLSFRYASPPPAGSPAGSTEGCVPELQRLASPAAALPAGLAPGPGGGAGPGGGGGATPPGGPVPNPPGTGPFSIQMFIGGTKYTYLAINLPTAYTSGAAIPNGTAVQLKIYRWNWSAKTWGAVQLESGSGEGPWSSGGRGQVGVNTFVSFVAITPVDCIEPRVVVLGATAVVNGVESAMTTDNLSFRYAAAPAADKPAGTTDDCIPYLERFATPAAALPPGLAPTPGAVPVTPGGLAPTLGGTRLEVRPGEAGRLDLIFVIDQTGSMQPVFNQVQRTAKEIFASIAARFPDHRVALVAYRDWSDGDRIFQDFPFTTDEAEFQKDVDTLKASGGGDTREAVLEALLRALRMPWRAGVNKQIILMGDAPPHTPIPDGPDKDKTASDVVKLAFEVDPAVINAIATPVGGAVSKETAAAFEDLAKRTGGTMTTADKAEEVPARIMDVVKDFKAATPAASGGGGAPVLPRTGGSLPAAGLVLLGLGALALLGGILVLARRRAGLPTPGAAPVQKVSAGLSITYANASVQAVRIISVKTTIGRAPDNTIVVNDGEVSSHHAEITASHDGFRLRDVGSANGTRVNGQPVVDVYLNVGDEIGVGTTRMTFTM